MAIQWFYLTGGGQAAGPVDTDELRRLAEAGIVRPDTLVRQATSGLWVRAAQVRGLFQQSDSSASRAGAAPPGSVAHREFTPLSPPPLENAPAFDPYYVWLGIPPSDRPLSHYRLLGIADFEDNAEVISNAADRQMAHVRAFQSGEHAEVCQKILNELARARVCLLDPAKKAAYDRALQQRQAAAPPPVTRLSTSQVRQEAELARRRRAEREPAAPAPAVVSGPATKKATEATPPAPSSSVGVSLPGPPAPPDAEPEPKGIGGWLHIPAIGLVLGPIMSAAYVLNGLMTIETFAPELMNDPRLWLSVLIDVGMIVATIIVAVLFFQRKRIAVPAIIGLIAAFILNNIVHPFLTVAMFEEVDADAIKHVIWTGVFRSVFGAIWILYFLKSKRVKNTFTE